MSLSRVRNVAFTLRCTDCWGPAAGQHLLGQTTKLHFCQDKYLDLQSRTWQDDTASLSRVQGFSFMLSLQVCQAGPPLTCSLADVYKTSHCHVLCLPCTMLAGSVV